MFTPELVREELAFAGALADRLSALGLDACSVEVAFHGVGRRVVRVNGLAGYPFIVHFWASNDIKPCLRVIWHGQRGRVNRPAGKNIASVAADVYADANEYFRDGTDALAKQEFLGQAAREAAAVKADFGLGCESGEVQIEEREPDTGIYNVVFLTGTPARAREVLAGLRAAGLV